MGCPREQREGARYCRLLARSMTWGLTGMSAHNPGCARCRPRSETGAVAAQDPVLLNLDVYDTRDGLWNPEYGSLEEPGGWEFLPRGDAFLTRRVKAGGVYWTLWRPRGAGRPHRRLLGLLAPKAAIEATQAQAAATAEVRRSHRVQGGAYRTRKEEAYRLDLAAAIVASLDFAPEHAQLAETIARRPPPGLPRWAAAGLAEPGPSGSTSEPHWPLGPSSGTATRTTKTDCSVRSGMTNTCTGRSRPTLTKRLTTSSTGIGVPMRPSVVSFAALTSACNLVP